MAFINCSATLALRYIEGKPAELFSREKERTHSGNKEKYTLQGFSRHFLNTGHVYESIKDTTKIREIRNKGPLMNDYRISTYKKKVTNQSMQLNDMLTDMHKQIYDVVLQRF